MNIVRRAAQSVGAGMSLTDLDRMMDSSYGQSTYTGKFVSQQTALAVGTVWACVQALADDISTLPLLTYRRVGGKRQRATDHYLWTLLLDQANPEMTAFRFAHLMETWMLLWGNAYAEVEISGRGQVTALWPWRPDRVKVSRAGSAFGPLQYTYTLANGQKFTVPHERMLHLRGMSLDGVMGLSPIEYHKQTIGLSMAVTEHGARFFSNGARPLGTLQHPQALSDKAYERIKDNWSDQHQGLGNAHRVAILEEGMKWATTGENMVDAQYIETAGMTDESIARMYKVPQHRVGLLKRATNNNVEELSLDYVLYTLAPIAMNWQSEIHSSLLSEREHQSIYTAFNFTNLLRGNHAAMGAFIATMRQWGILNADEVREDYLDMDEQANGTGKTYWEPSNMMPAQPPGMSGMQTVQPPKSKPNGVLHQ